MESPLQPDRRSARARTAPPTVRLCIGCVDELPAHLFSRNQIAKPQAKCKACVASALNEARQEQELAPKAKRCVQCFQDLPMGQFSKRQLVQVDGKCKGCVDMLEREAARVSSAIAGKWSYDRYYRCCHRGKTGGVGVRTKTLVASPVLGTVPLGRVVKATQVLYNEQGDPIVKLESLTAVHVSREDKGDAHAKHRDGWVPCRSIKNEVYLERHSGPWLSSENIPSRHYRCVIEGCKVRSAADMELVEIGYVLYGDVIEIVECHITDDGLVFLRLHNRYFDGPAWAVERSLDNESVLNQIDGPSSEPTQYRCVQDGGAPTRREPSLSASPVGRIRCGAVVTVVERVITPERLVFLRLSADELQKANDSSQSELWVIETSTVCASVMVKCDE